MFITSVVICSVVCAKNGLILDSRCEPITSWVCDSIGYNFTTFPNAMNHQTQEDAHLDIVSFSLLLDTQCSAVVRFFMCSQYIPICIENYHKPLKPCRSVCERSRDDCTPFWSLMGYDWPKEMACDQFPDETEEICLKPDNFEGFCDCSCKTPLITTNNDAKVGSIEKCTVPCRGVFFTKDERNFIDIWIKLLSAIAFICTLITLTTFIMETKKPTFPEKSIEFITFCSFVVATGFVYSKFLGHDEIACNGSAIKSSSTDLSSCTFTFCLIYYFGMASSIWWAILSFTWFTAASLKWSNESIERYSRSFHCVAWIVPAIQTFTVIWFGAVDGDPVAGICYIGNANMQNLKVFVIIPSIIYFLIGTVFLLAGFLSLALEMRAKKPTAKRSIHLGIFSALYMMPLTFIIGCQLYEISFFDEWLTEFTCPCNQSGSKPNASMFLMKYIMIFAFGMTSIIWIWIDERFISWKHCVPQIIRYDRNRVVHTLLNENNVMLYT